MFVFGFYDVFNYSKVLYFKNGDLVYAWFLWMMWQFVPEQIVLSRFQGRPLSLFFLLLQRKFKLTKKLK